MITVDGDRLRIAGAVNMDTVAALYAQGLTHLKSRDWVLDFAAVDSVDSSAVGLLLGWLRAAQAAQHSLRLENIPASLRSLAQLYGVDEMLPTPAN